MSEQKQTTKKAGDGDSASEQEWKEANAVEVPAEDIISKGEDLVSEINKINEAVEEKTGSDVTDEDNCVCW